MALNFEYFIPDRRFLKASAVRAAGLSSAIYPEMPSGEDIAAIAKKLGAKTGRIEVYEFGKNPISMSGSIDELVEFYKQKSYANCLVLIDKTMWIWAPEHHEYFVVFGDAERHIKEILKSIFEYGFHEYIDDFSQSEAKKNFLSAAQKQYDFSGS